MNAPDKQQSIDKYTGYPITPETEMTLDELIDHGIRLHNALKKYGTHGWDCKQHGECTCGLTEAINETHN